MGELFFGATSTQFITVAVIQGVFIVVATFANSISWIVGRVIVTPNIMFKQMFQGLVFMQLMNLIFAETFNLIILTIENWNLGRNMCIFSINVGMSSEIISTWLLTLLVVDGYLKSRFNNLYKYLYERRLTVISCLIWFVLFAVFVPVNYLLTKDAYIFHNTTQIWQCHLPLNNTNVIINFILRYLMPGTISISLLIYLKCFLKKFDKTLKLSTFKKTVTLPKFNKTVTPSNILTNQEPEDIPDIVSDDQRPRIPQRPRTPWSIEWRNKINNQINSGPNNTLPPICSYKPTRERLSSIALNGDSISLTKNIEQKICHYTGALDETSLLRDLLPPLRRKSLPDMRTGEELKSMPPMVAWRKMSISRSTENIPDSVIDDVQSWGGSGGCSPNESEDIKIEALRKKIDKYIVKQRLNTKPQDLTLMDEVAKALVKKPFKSTQFDNSVISYSTQHNNFTSENNSTEQLKYHKKSKRLKSKSKKREKQVKNQQGEQTDIIILQSDLTDYQCDLSIPKTDIANKHNFFNEKEERRRLINIFCIIIGITQLVVLPKLGLVFYLTSCDDCSVDFLVFHCLSMIDKATWALTPILIIMFHDPFRYTLYFLLFRTQHVISCMLKSKRFGQDTLEV